MNTRTHLVLVAAAAAGCGTDVPDGPELTGESYMLSWGQVTVAPGSEATRCVILDLGNDQPVKIHQIHNQLGSISHHLVLYREDGPGETQTEPFDCEPFSGTLSVGTAISPLMITQKHDDLLTLPRGVAYTFEPHQRIRIEQHYVNTSDVDQVASATSELFVGVADQIRDEASFLFIGTPDIELPPQQVTSIDAFLTLPPELQDSQFFAITGHTHRLGTDVQVRYAAGRDAARTSVYAPEPFIWSEPATTRHEPAFRVPAGGGFDFHCEFDNTTPDVVTFGESAHDEMCFFWAYYYPSKGARMCVHSTLAGGPEGLDVCCPPAPGDDLAELVCPHLSDS
jgi:hypothetical protein